ncbi:MAG: stage III sporulation protein AF [Lachnospiraceae bacterium]|nr:stage III sporulation protein AF [Lachnospiraceae bacterium]
MGQWLKTLTGSMCVITILMHLLPGGKFTKYIRFYAGLLFFLMAIRPIMNFFTGEGEFERLLQLEFLKEEYYDMETSIAGMEELKSDQVAEAYRSELYRQIQAMADSYGISVTEMELKFDGGDGYLLEKIEIVTEAGAGEQDCEALKDELSGLYMVEKRDILIKNRRGQR